MNPREKTSVSKKTLSALLCVIFATGSFFAIPPKAHAVIGIEDIVFDPTAFVKFIVIAEKEIIQAENAIQGTLKEFVLDPIAYQVATIALQSVTRSIINWVASGFQGSPAFVTDLSQNALRVGDTAANTFLNELASDGRINSPFRSVVNENARSTYYRNSGSGAFGTAHPYTLNQSCQNDAAFLGGDFNSCGISGWMSAWINPQNNPYGGSLLTTDALFQRASTAQQNEDKELSYGQGFRSYRNCSTKTASSASTGSDGKPATGSSGASSSVSLSNTDPNQNCPITTLGSTIMAASNKAGLSGIDRIVSADELDEIIGNLFAQLISNVLQNGFGGASSPSSGGGRSALDLATDPSQAGTVGGDFKGIVQQSLTDTQRYQTNWQKIQQAALDAKAACGDTATVTTATVQPVIDQAATALAFIPDAMAKLQAILTEVTINETAGQPGSQATSSTPDLTHAATEYSALVRSGHMPNSTQVGQSDTDADANNAGGLYAKMVAALAGCQ